MKAIYKYSLKREKVLQIAEGTKTDSPNKIVNFLRAIKLDEEEQEHLLTIILDTHNNVKAYYTITIGLLDQAPAHAREVFRQAIIQGAASIVIAHNHPSGNVQPSRHDMQLTRKMRDAGQIIGIKLLDHVIIGDGYFSFLEEGHI